MNLSIDEAQALLDEKLQMLGREDAAATGKRRFHLVVDGELIASGISVAHCVGKAVSMRITEVVEGNGGIKVDILLFGKTVTETWSPTTKEAFFGLVEWGIEDAIKTACDENDGVKLFDQSNPDDLARLHGHTVMSEEQTDYS